MSELDALRDEVARLRQWLELDLPDRIADHLYGLPNGRLEADGSWRVLRPPSKAELAKVVGSCRETAVRVVGKMRATYQIVYGRCDLQGRPITLYLSPALVRRVRELREQRGGTP